jgi:hypothetical protein
MIARSAGAQRPCRGEVDCGDAFLVLDGDITLVVVVDGLGHGPKAREAALRFVELADHQRRSSPQQILEAGNAALSGTRGVAAMVARLDCLGGTIDVAGVGNIELRAISKFPITPISTPGIVGRPVRTIREFHYPLSTGDLLVLSSDGISRRAEIAQYSGLDLDAMAEALLQEYGSTHDDATCVVVRMEDA